MRILAIADVEEPVLYEESKRAKVGNIDLIISCGDLSRDYLSYISTTYGAPLFFVRGNHDMKLFAEGVFGENLHNRLVRYKNLYMLGFEGAMEYTDNSVHYSESEMNHFYRKILLKTFFYGVPDIIVTHTPPKGIHDGIDHYHQGFTAFKKAIGRFKPKYFLHGHTHLTYDHKLPRMTVVGSTKVINVYGYYIIDYDEELIYKPITY